MTPYEKLLLENKAWASEKVEDDPSFFTRLEDIQSPDFLWIGCSDSRVPADQITGTKPGEIFVHRNIANMVVHTDLNLLSVLEYAVHYLKVKHVIVCGHYGCGGVKSALTKQNFGILNKWLRNIKDVYRMHKDEIEAHFTEHEKVDALIEYNVKEQVINLAKTSIIQKAWKEDKAPQLHGWVYSLHDGKIKTLIDINIDYKLDSIYEFDDL
jgi:carbonic anhydrase